MIGVSSLKVKISSNVLFFHFVCLHTDGPVVSLTLRPFYKDVVELDGGLLFLRFVLDGVSVKGA